MNLLQLARGQWDRVLAGGLFVLGGLAVVLGWVGASKQALTALQLPYAISGGIGGLFLLGLGAVFWISADLRDEWRKLDAIERRNAEQRDAIQPLAKPRTPARAK